MSIIKINVFCCIAAGILSYLFSELSVCCRSPIPGTLVCERRSGVLRRGPSTRNDALPAREPPSSPQGSAIHFPRESTCNNLAGKRYQAAEEVVSALIARSKATKRSRKRSRIERKRLRSSGNVALDCVAALAKTGTFAFFISLLVLLSQLQSDKSRWLLRNRTFCHRNLPRTGDARRVPVWKRRQRQTAAR
jgi:hypothetical protein